MFTSREQIGYFLRGKIDTEQRKEKSLQTVSENTKIRCEIHGIIIGGIKAGKTKQEIIQELSKERYKDYSEFFGSWIDDRQISIKKNKEARKLTR